MATHPLETLKDVCEIPIKFLSSKSTHSYEWEAKATPSLARIG